MVSHHPSVVQAAMCTSSGQEREWELHCILRNGCDRSGSWWLRSQCRELVTAKLKVVWVFGGYHDFCSTIEHHSCQDFMITMLNRSSHDVTYMPWQGQIVQRFRVEAGNSRQRTRLRWMWGITLSLWKLPYIIKISSTYDASRLFVAVPTSATMKD